MLRDVPRSPRPATPVPCLLILLPPSLRLQDAVNSGSWHVRSVLSLWLTDSRVSLTSKHTCAPTHTHTYKHTHTFCLSPSSEYCTKHAERSYRWRRVSRGGTSGHDLRPAPRHVSRDIFRGLLFMLGFLFFLYQHYKEYITIITINIY